MHRFIKIQPIRYRSDLPDSANVFYRFRFITDSDICFMASPSLCTTNAILSCILLYLGLLYTRYSRTIGVVGGGGGSSEGSEEPPFLGEKILCWFHYYIKLPKCFKLGISLHLRSLKLTGDWIWFTVGTLRMACPNPAFLPLHSIYQTAPPLATSSYTH